MTGGHRGWATCPDWPTFEGARDGIWTQVRLERPSFLYCISSFEIMARVSALFDGVQLPGGLVGRAEAWCWENSILSKEETSLLISGCYPLATKPYDPLSFSHPPFSRSMTKTPMSPTQISRTLLEIKWEAWCQKRTKQMWVTVVSVSPTHNLTLAFLSFTVTTSTEKDPGAAG